MNPIHHSKAYHWRVLASSVALSALSSNGLAYASPDISEPVIPEVSHAVIPDAATPLFSHGANSGVTTSQTQISPKFSALDSDTLSSPVNDDIAAAEMAVSDLASTETVPIEEDAFVQVPPALSPVTPQFSVSPSPAPSVEPSATDATVLENSVTDTAATETAAEAPSNVSPTVSGSQVEILNPTTGSVVDVPAITVIIRFPSGADIELKVNDDTVSSDLIGRTETDPATNLVTQTWYGVALSEGTNTLTVVRGSDGTMLQSAAVEVRGTPVEMTLRSRESKVAADGRSTVTLQGQLLDENGNVSNWDAVVTLVASDGEFVGVDYAPDQPGFQVEAKNGRFTAELQSSLEAHIVQLQAITNGLEAFNQVQFVTPQRPSIATGIVDLRFGARGTNFHDSLRDFLPPEGNNNYELDLDASLFTMGNLGEWLFTGAFNSDRPLNEDCRGETALFRQSSGSCNNLYPVYGDDSTIDVTTPSTDRVYVRLERTSPVEGATAD